MKPKLFLALSALLLIVNVSAQYKIIVRSAKDNSLLPFATIINTSRKGMYSANEKGLLYILAAKGDVLTVSYVGFVTSEFIVKEVTEQTILLSPSLDYLPEIAMSSCKKFKNVIVSNLPEKETIGGFLGVMCPKSLMGGKVAVYLPSDLVNSRLVKFSFWIDKYFWAPDYSINSPFIISFFSVGDTTNLPDQLIYNKPIFYHPKNAGKQTIKLDSSNIRVPKEGIYVCFQYIMDEKYQWEQRLTDTTIIHQGPVIKGVSATGYQLAFFNFETSCWHFATNLKDLHWEKPHGTIEFEAVLKTCNE